MKSKQLTLGLLLVVFSLLAAACNGPSRAASTPVQVPGEEQPGDSVIQTDEPEPAATDAPSQVETLMAGDLATATAVAGGEVQPVETQAPTAEPLVTEATVNNPTAAPTQAPTNAPQPTKTPEPAVDCSSPYTVQKGDWVWDIGRRCNIHPDSIIAVNGLVYPYIIYPGDVLVLPTNAPPFPGP